MDHIASLLLGLGNGGVFAALALALVITYRASGVVNFGTGAVALYVAYTYAGLRKGELLVIVPGLPKTVDLGQELGFWTAAAISLGLAALLGALLYLLVFRPLREAPPLARAVASLGVLVVLQGVLAIRQGTNPVSVRPILLALLGPNGAGKSTLLLTLAGLLPAHSGTVAVDGVALRNGNAAAASRAGVVLVRDNRCLFTTLSVEENLEVARRRGGPAPRELVGVFPALEKRWHLPAGALSGGEQQMLAMARALIQQPKVLLVDEMSMGLAPLVVETLFDTVRQIARDHATAIVLVEQHVALALRVADEAAVLNRGTVVLRGAAQELSGDSQRLEQAYFEAAGPASAPAQPAR